MNKKRLRMSFVCERREVKDEFPEWEYLNAIGVRDMFGHPLDKFTTSLIVDRENNYYLISRGHTNPNRDIWEIDFYTLCLDGEVINLEVVHHSKMNHDEKRYERHWIIEKITFPPNWTFININIDKLFAIIEEAFTAYYFSRTFRDGWSKEMTVEITAPITIEDKGR